MGFKCGIVGLPNVGKSTLFNALTKSSVPAENYPFCTIEPNVGCVPVPDARLARLASIVTPQEIIPAAIQFVDIAGLVKGASEGEGLGNQFLSHIRETDAIAHVIRCFEDPNIIHVEGQVSPLNDIKTINMELILADIQTVEKALTRVSKSAKSANEDAIEEKQFLEQLLKFLNSEKPARQFSLTDSDIEKATKWLHDLCLLTSKPVLYIANVAENGLQNNPLLDQLNAYAQQENAKVIPICALWESALTDLKDGEKNELMKEFGLTEPGLNRLIQAGYDVLGLQTYFTAGPKEVRAWTIHKGDRAPQAAGRIHTDFEKGFIRAEVIAYADFIQYGGEIGAKAAGKWRLEGKDYIVQDGDVMHFRFTT